jgi:hypothetical protein
LAGARVAIHVFSSNDVTQYMTSARDEDLAILYCAARLHTRFRDLVAVELNNQITIPFTLPADKGLAGIHRVQLNDP